MALKSLKPLGKSSDKKTVKKPRPVDENGEPLPKIEKGETQSQPNNPLHGVKLADMLKVLSDDLGWEKMHLRTGIKAFGNNPTYKSSLKFLRTTPWAREKVENMYLKYLKRKG